MKNSTSKATSNNEKATQDKHEQAAEQTRPNETTIEYNEPGLYDKLTENGKLAHILSNEYSQKMQELKVKFLLCVEEDTVTDKEEVGTFVASYGTIYDLADMIANTTISIKKVITGGFDA